MCLQPREQARTGVAAVRGPDVRTSRGGRRGGVELVQFADELAGFGCDRKVFGRVTKAAEHMRPAACKLDPPLGVAGAAGVGGSRVAHDGTGVATDEIAKGRRTFVVADAMDRDRRPRAGLSGDRTTCGKRPHLPRLLPGDIKAWPRGLIEADDRPREQLRLQRVDGGREQPAEPVDQIPQRLGRDVEATLSGDRDLACERDLMRVFIDGGFDGDSEAVARTARRTLRAQRGFDAATAAAHILLAFHLHDAVLHVDDIDHFGFFKLSGHRTQAAATRRACTVGLVEYEGLFDNRQPRLRRRASDRAWLGRARGRRCGGWRHRRGDWLLRRGKRVDQRQRLLQFLLAAFELFELAAFLSELREQLCIRRIEREGDAAQLFDILFLLKKAALHTSF